MSLSHYGSCDLNYKPNGKKTNLSYREYMLTLARQKPLGEKLKRKVSDFRQQRSVKCVALLSLLEDAQRV